MEVANKPGGEPFRVAPYFDVLLKFPSTGSVRLAWSYPGGPQIFSRTVSVHLH